MVTRSCLSYASMRLIESACAFWNPRVVQGTPSFEVSKHGPSRKDSQWRRDIEDYMEQMYSEFKSTSSNIAPLLDIVEEKMVPSCEADPSTSMTPLELPHSFWHEVQWDYFDTGSSLAMCVYLLYVKHSSTFCKIPHVHQNVVDYSLILEICLCLVAMSGLCTI